MCRLLESFMWASEKWSRIDREDDVGTNAQVEYKRVEAANVKVGQRRRDAVAVAAVVAAFMLRRYGAVLPTVLRNLAIVTIQLGFQ